MEEYSWKPLILTVAAFDNMSFLPFPKCYLPHLSSLGLLLTHILAHEPESQALRWEGPSLRYPLSLLTSAYHSHDCPVAIPTVICRKWPSDGEPGPVLPPGKPCLVPPDLVHLCFQGNCLVLGFRYLHIRSFASRLWTLRQWDVVFLTLRKSPSTEEASIITLKSE